MPDLLTSSDTSVPPGTITTIFDKVIAWVQSHMRWLLIAGVAFQGFVLVAMIGLRALPLLVGQTILLKVEPIDPRDMMRGDYVILNYQISRLPVSGIPGASPVDGREEDVPVYVSLEPDPGGRYWHATAASLDRPRTGTYIRGKYSPTGWGSPIKFGIEAYYVQEGMGKKFEEARSTGHLHAEVALAPWGQAALRGLRIE